MYEIRGIPVPEDVIAVIRRLESSGYEAWAVGGCVRDAMLGHAPKDWDLCTSASPAQMQAVFAGEHVVETGLQHGTLTVVLHHVPYEITAYRIDGEYTDHRHPDRVLFVKDILQDLSRRDLTINAMAWHPERGLEDPFGGEKDLDRGIIRCVGHARHRFDEDALRILRALRFSAVLGFPLDAETEEGVRTLAGTLDQVAGERIYTELGKLLCGRNAASVLSLYPDVLSAVFPDLAREVHCSWTGGGSLYDYSVRCVKHALADRKIRLALLFHALGFTDASVSEAVSVQRSAEMAERMLARLHPERELQTVVHSLILNQLLMLSADRIQLIHQLHQLGEKNLRHLIDFQEARWLTERDGEAEQVRKETDAIRKALDGLIADHVCFSLRDLAIKGRDLMNIGIPRGPEIGIVLDRLLEEVMNGTASNEKEALMNLAWTKYREYELCGTEPFENSH
ncbi:MAG: tRNA nucleotidyltransferase [Clostridia bacterium]|nr:tRNA nucleotidyltransferase [Clostridia bacterium]